MTGPWRTVGTGVFGALRFNARTWVTAMVLGSALTLTCSGIAFLLRGKPVELVYEPVLPAGAAATPELLEELRAGVAARLARRGHVGEVAVSHGTIRVLLSAGSRSALDKVRAGLGRSVRFGIHAVDERAMRGLRDRLAGAAAVSENEGVVRARSSRREDAEALARALAPSLAPGRKLAIHELRDGGPRWELLLLGPAALGEQAIRQAKAVEDEYGLSMALRLYADGTDALGAFTRARSGERMAITVDGRVQTVTVIRSEIATGELAFGVDGSTATSEQEAKELAAALEFGTALPVPLRLASERTAEREDR